MITIRPMRPKDLDDVAAIEAAFNPFPWPRSQFAGSLVNGHRCRIAELGQSVCGFSIFSSVLDEATLLNIGVHQAHQGLGYGRSLLLEGLQTLQEQGIQQCLLEVRASNRVAQNLYRSMGFQVVGQRNNYYPAFEGKEDALVMAKSIAADTVC